MSTTPTSVNLLDPNVTPWMPPAAIERLAELMRPEWTVLEFGAGGSTLWFARRVAKVVSIEHSDRWSNRVADALDHFRLQNALVIHVESTPATRSSPTEYVSAKDGRCYQNYVQVGVETAVLEAKTLFDLALIDGRARVSAVQRASAVVKTDGWLALDDGHRERYSPAAEFLIERGWVCQRIGDRRRSTDFWKRWRPELTAEETK